MANSSSKSIFGIGCFLISSLAYIIAIGVGWAAWDDPDGGAIRPGIIIVTIPVFAVFFCCLAYKCCGDDSTITRFVEVCTTCSVVLAGVLELIGGIFLIVQGTQLEPDHRTTGIVAGVFSIIAAISCCCSAVTARGSTGADDNSTGIDDDDTRKKSVEEDVL